VSALRLHRFEGLRPGPRLLVLGAVHSNETCGPVAIGRLIAALDAGEVAIERGVLTLVPVTHPIAFARGRCESERNLNRDLRPARRSGGARRGPAGDPTGDRTARAFRRAAAAPAAGPRSAAPGGGCRSAAPGRPVRRALDQLRTGASRSADRRTARRHDGAMVRAPYDSRVVFPHPGAMPGHEWFYFARPSDRRLLQESR